MTGRAPTRLRTGIRTQLLVPVAILLLAMTAAGAWTAVSAGREARDQVDVQVRQVGETLSHAHYPLTAHVLEIAKGLSGVEFVLDARSTDNPAARRVTLEQTIPLGDPGVLAAVEPAGNERPGLGGRIILPAGPYLCHAVRVEQGPDAGAVLYMLVSERRWVDAFWEAAYPSVLLAGTSGMFAVVIGVGFARTLSRRIRDLERQTRRIASGDFAATAVTGRDDELSDLGRSVNTMAGKLAALQEAARTGERLRLLGQVSGGLAHQLRNGVTGARLAVQLAEMGDTEGLTVALRQLRLVELHLKQFLSLGAAKDAPTKPVSLAAVIDEAVSLLRPRATHTGTTVAWERPNGQAIIPGHADDLGHLVINLLTNAIEAAGPGGAVEVRVTTADGSHRLEVVDSGPGPPAALLERLFEPFVTGKAEGVGLGLAVARQVAETHGGAIGWERVGGRTRFWVTFPRANG